MTMERFEYQFITRELQNSNDSAPDMVRLLNEQGEQGWEAWHMISGPSLICNGMVRVFVWLKRRKFDG